MCISRSICCRRGSQMPSRVTGSGLSDCTHQGSIAVSIYCYYAITIMARMAIVAIMAMMAIVAIVAILAILAIMAIMAIMVIIAITCPCYH